MGMYIIIYSVLYAPTVQNDNCKVNQGNIPLRYNQIFLRVFIVWEILLFVIYVSTIGQFHQSASTAMGFMMILHIGANIFLEQITFLLLFSCNKV